MKIAILSTLYRGAIKWFYKRNPSIAEKPYWEHKQLFDDEVSLWASAWGRALSKQNHDVLTFPLNAKPLLSAWATNESVSEGSHEKIILELLQRFRPDIVWFDSWNVAILKSIKKHIASIRLVLGVSGSAIGALDIFRETDVILTPAPETVGRLSDKGFTVYHLDHAFDPQWMQNVQRREKDYGAIFIGQIVRGETFHVERERMLKELVEAVDLNIFSPTFDMGIQEVLATFASQAAYVALLPIRKMGLSSHFSRIEKIRKVLELSHLPRLPYDRQLKKKMSPPVYGVEMLQLLSDSQVVVNIHADSSPSFASNMRLFETTGAGSTLLTEHRKNISDLFRVDTEIVTYTSSQDCAEKAHWLLSHPTECSAIAEAGQRRTQREHTFAKRAQNFLEIVERHISS